eukprot:2976459-Karenia_brevis.AAC.1
MASNGISNPVASVLASFFDKSISSSSHLVVLSPMKISNKELSTLEYRDLPKANPALGDGLLCNTERIRKTASS